MLASRILTAAVLGLFFVAILFEAPRAIWLCTCAAIMAAACWEWGRLAGLSVLLNLAFSLALLAAVAALALLEPLQAYLPAVHGFASVAWIVVAPVLIVRRPRMERGAGILAGFIVLIPAFSALIWLRDAGAALTLAVASVVWVSDTAAYFVGRKFGRHKLAPAVSPGKTWEGVLGALAGVAIYALAWTFFPASAVPPGRLAQGPVLIPVAIAFALLGIAGDLFESLLKRNAGVKDSGRLLPGHGGVLDRIDALLPVLPAAAWLFAR